MSLIAGNLYVCVRACVPVRARSRPPSGALLLRERTSDGAAGPMAGNRSEVDEVKTARGQVSKRRYYHWQFSHFSEPEPIQRCVLVILAFRQNGY